MDLGFANIDGVPRVCLIVWCLGSAWGRLGALQCSAGAGHVFPFWRPGTFVATTGHSQSIAGDATLCPS